MHDIILAHVDRGSVQPVDIKPILDEASEMITNLTDKYARARRQLAMDRTLKAPTALLYFLIMACQSG